MPDVNGARSHSELKGGSVKLLILALLEARPQHGYELSKLVHVAGGQLTFEIDSLDPLSIGSKSASGSIGRGSSNPKSAVAASTSSPPTVGACSLASRTVDTFVAAVRRVMGEEHA